MLRQPLTRLVTIAAFLIASNHALASGYFVDLSLGANKAKFDTLKFLNPVGAAADHRRSPVSGDRIILDNVDNKDYDSSYQITAGAEISDRVILRVSYRDFGKLKTTGGARFNTAAPGHPENIQSFQQVLIAEPQTLMLGAAYKIPIAKNTHLEPYFEVGKAKIDTRGTQGTTGRFPKKSHSNTAYALGLSITHGISDRISLVGSMYYLDLGKVSTGVTGNLRPAGMNPREQLKSSEIEIQGVSVGLRYAF